MASALENPFDEITWITPNYQAKSGDCRVANSFYVFRLRAMFLKIDPATGVIAGNQKTAVAETEIEINFKAK